MEIYNGSLTGNFDEDTAVLDAVLRTEASFDMLRKTMEVAGARIVMYYIDVAGAELAQSFNLTTDETGYIGISEYSNKDNASVVDLVMSGVTFFPERVAGIVAGSITSF